MKEPCFCDIEKSTDWYCVYCKTVLVPEDYPHTCTSSNNWTTYASFGVDFSEHLKEE